MLNPLLLLFLLLLLLTSRAPMAVSAQDSLAPVNPYASLCNQSLDIYDAHSRYLSNLRALGANLSRDASASGFAIGRAGVAPDDVYGLVLCRGDLPGANCTRALAAAFLDVTGRAQPCLYYKDAAFYYDMYMLRFTGNASAISSLSNEPEWSGSNMNAVTDEKAAAQFMDRAVGLMNRVADLAAVSNSSGRYYANGEDWFGAQGVDKIYGLAQCTPDMTAGQCRSCLAGIIRQMPLRFSGPSGSLIGGRILGVRCNLRYEKELFFLETENTIMPKGRMSTAHKIIAVGVPCVVLLISGLLLRPYIVKQARELLLQRDLVTLENEIVRESDSRFLLFRISKIRDATNNFSEQNKLGEGGFGPVYKGRLSNNQEAAIKRLSPNSVQGFREFKNEIKLIARLQHRHLVRLLGCCITSKERILVYEYMENGNLEDIIFGEGANMSWPVRRRIIEGIADGLLYIHNYAHECIVHRDLKPSNILLDQEMNPKISDFGIARICLSNVTESSTRTVMGTPGYIAPEYCSQNVYSTKSDVYSFGILVLEIISGKRAAGSHELAGRSYELRRYAWQLWREDRCDEFVDPSLGEEYQEMDIIRCIQVALLCVQDSPEDRPTMHDVIMMLSNRNRRLLAPAQPGSL
ncbi:hypothetical protein ACP70R_031476 [Stipagrostis hirtigluma subsp. patula]